MKYLCSIGSSDYENPKLENLPFAKNDAVEVYNILTDDSIGVATKRSTLLIDLPKRQLVKELGKFFRSLSNNDEYIVFFSGHAGRLPSGDWAFYCRDTDPNNKTLTALSYRDLNELMHQHNRSRGILIFDTCYARSASGLQGNLRVKGGVHKIMPQITREGTIVIWACGSEDQTFEQGGHGLFTGLFLGAIRCGADLGAHEYYVSPANVVRWIKRKLREGHYDEKLSPSFRSAGDTTGLYLSRNPRFSETDVKSSKFEALETTNFSDLIENLASDIGLTADSLDSAEELHNLKSIGQQVASASLLGSQRDFQVIETSISRVLWNCTKYTIPGAALLALLISTEFGDIVGYMAFLLIGVLLFLFQMSRRWDFPNHFLIVCKYGIFEGYRKNNTTSEFVAIPWSIVREIDRYTKYDNGGYSDILNVWTIGKFETSRTISKAVAKSDHRASKWPVFFSNLIDRKIHGTSYQNVDFVGGLDSLQAAFEKGMMLRSQINLRRTDKSDSEIQLFEIEKTEHLPTFALSGVTKYLYLQELPGVKSDIFKLKDVLERNVKAQEIAVCQDVDIEGFENWLGEIFKNALHEVLAVYFSGHGILSEGGELYLALNNTKPEELLETGVPVRKFLDLMMENQLLHLFLIFDCCFSGTAGENVGLGGRSLANMELLFSEERDILTIIAASGSKEEARENENGGVFTGIFSSRLDSLLADDDVIVVKELVDSALETMAEKGMGQHGRAFSSDIGFNFPLFRRKNSLRATGEGVIDEARREIESLFDKEKREQIGRLQEYATALQSYDLKRFGSDGGVINFPIEGFHVCRSPGTISTGLQIGCLIMFLPAIFLSVLTLFAGVSDNLGDVVEWWVGLIVASIALGIIISGIQKDPPRFLLLAEQGIVFGGDAEDMIFPALDIAGIDSSVEFSNIDDTAQERRTELALWTHQGQKVVLADSTQKWLPGFDQMVFLAEEFSVKYNLEARHLGLDALGGRILENYSEREFNAAGSGLRNSGVD